ncbi:pseudouridine synthase [Dokdonella sp.]|uniref:pseudouridine synthase n=1 Tax=Dokdonella sp. TaxID=2291710 RepID=UPI002F3F746B
MRARRTGSSRAPTATNATAPRHGLARVISKLGIASRTQAARWIAAGRVSVDGRVVRDPERPTDAARERIAIDDDAVAARERVYLALNKPRGVVTTADDERGRDTVYALLDGSGLPWLAPVGRLDRASEGLLLFSNDSAWAAAITAPESRLDKTYHVQIDRLPDATLLEAMRAGVVDRGERLAVKAVRELRRGERHAWLEIVLDEGRNRQIRRVLAALDVGVLRLVRVAIGPLALGSLARGAWRLLEPAEVAALASRSRIAAR